jgi:hypothetical protein
MKRLLSACAIVCGVIMLYGFIAGNGRDRLKIQTREDKPDFTITVSLPDLTPEYRYVSLHACTAERGEENPQAYCTYFWERESTQETRGDQFQYPFRWRSVPGGLLLVTAMAFDAEGKVRASHSLPVQRGF